MDSRGSAAGRGGLTLVLAVALALAGCSSSESEQEAQLATQPALSDRPLADEPSDLARDSGPQGLLAIRQMGTGEFVNQDGRFQSTAEVEEVNGGEYSVNLSNVPVDQAAQAILGDALGLTYTIAPGVSGRITLLTSRPISSKDMLETFNTVLQLNGLSLKFDNNIYIVEQAAGSVGMPRFRLEAGRSPAENAVYVLPLRFISAAEMIRILEPITSPSAALGSNQQRNILFAKGSGADIEAITEAVDLFDIDVLKGKSVSLVKLSAADPTDVAGQLDQVFDSFSGGALDGVLRFMPNDALGSILIVSSQPDYIRRAEAWIQRYEALAFGQGANVVVYPLENRSAVDLAPILTELLSFGPADFGGAGAPPGAATTAPGTGTAAPGAAATAPGAGAPPPVPGAAAPPPVPGAGVPVPGAGAVPPVPGATAAAYQAPPVPQVGEQARFVADDVSNAIIAYATPSEQEQIARIIQQLDNVAHQVLLEATIAEVTLTDDLKFGVRWFFENGNFSFNFTGEDDASTLPTALIPGFNALFATSDIRVAIDALSSVTDVNIISSPSLLVLDNREAVLSVGDQVPIATQSVVSIVDPESPIVNSITQEDTGVILTIQPRVSDSGRVILEIEQEVSDVVETDTSDIDSPTIQQRIITTTVAVDDGQSVALGGLIRETRRTTRSQIPLLGDIPLLGWLFRSTFDEDERTELLVIITPKLIRDAAQARQATEEFRRRLSGPGDLMEAAPRTTGHRFKRIFY